MCFQAVLGVFQGSFNGVEEVSRVFQRSYIDEDGGVFRVFQRSFKDVLGKFKGYFKKVPKCFNFKVCLEVSLRQL